MTGELLLAWSMGTIIYTVIVIVLCTYMIKDGLRMRKERKEMEARRERL